MICQAGLASTRYLAEMTPGSPVPAIPCPQCGRKMDGHGWYKRYLHRSRRPMRRLRCLGCCVSHALLPEDICAYQDLTLTALEEAKQRDGPTAAAQAAGCEGEVRRARRWLRSPVWQQLLGFLNVGGDPWERVVTLVGPEPGMLLRLRHWLGSKSSYLLGGPCGLFRHGRPPSRPRPVST